MPAPNEDDFNAPVLPNDDKPLSQKAPKQYADMTPAERREFLQFKPAPVKQPTSTQHVSEMTEEQIMKLKESWGIRPSHAEISRLHRRARAAQFSK